MSGIFSNQGHLEDHGEYNAICLDDGLSPHENAPQVAFQMEPLSMDDFKGNTSSHGGYNFVQVFFGALSFMINVHGMKKQKHFVRAHQDFLREEGVPSTMRHDQAKNEKSKEVMKIHCELLIGRFLGSRKPTAKSCGSTRGPLVKEQYHCPDGQFECSRQGLV